jgi:hypothetical protein
MIAPLSQHLQRINQLSGPADISLIQQSYEDWYKAAQSRFQGQDNRKLAEAYFNRHRGHVLKLAVIYEASSSLSLRVTHASWQRAVVTAFKAENTIFKWLLTGMSASGFLLSQMIEEIRQAGTAGLPLGDFTRRFQHKKGWERDEKLATLIQADILSCFRRQTQGRPANTLVYADFVANYAANHPKETQVSSP